MADNILMTKVNVRYVVRVANTATFYVVRKNDGSIDTSLTMATAYSTIEGANGLLRDASGKFGKLAVDQFELRLHRCDDHVNSSNAVAPVEDLPVPALPVDAKARVTQIINEQLGLEFYNKPLDYTASFASLGADSLDLVELVMAIEDEFGFEINDDEAERCSTTDHVIDLVRRKGFK